MNSKLLIAASLALAAVSGAASADTGSSYAERMRLIGRTAQTGDQGPAQYVDSNSGKLLSAAEQRQQHAARMALIGRTAAFGETSVTPADSTIAGSAQQQFEQRMKLIGRTVQQGELAGYNVETNNRLSAQRATKQTAQ